MRSVAKPRLVVLFKIAVAFAAALSALAFPACGVESSAYLESVEQGGGAITQVELTNKATVSLPGSGGVSSYFGYWSILYRIYVSGTPMSGQIQTSSGGLGQVNSYLASDYRDLYSYTDITNNTIQSTNIYTTFKNKGYYEIALEGVDDISIPMNIFDQNLVIEFPSPAGSIPTLSITDKNTGAVSATYKLLRSTGFPTDGIHDKTNNPLPSVSRYFINSDELNASANNSKTNNDTNSWNLDVADNSSAPASPRYTYASLYIIALGRDTNSTWNLISSRPTFIAILRLPEK